MKKLYILISVSGGGKSTYALKLLKDNPTLAVCSADHFFVDSNGVYKFDAQKLGQAHQKCQVDAGIAMAKGLPVVVDNTNLKWGDISPYIRIASVHGYEISFILFDAQEADLPMLAERNRHGVPEAAIKRQYNNLVSLRKSLKRDMGTAFPGIKFTLTKERICQ